MRSRLTTALVASALTTLALVTVFGASPALADDPPPALLNVALPSVSGFPQVGELAGASEGAWNAVTTTAGVPTQAGAVPDSYSYQWYTVTSGDTYTAIPTGTTASITVPANAYTAGRIAVEVTAHLAGHDDASAMSDPVGVQPYSAIIYSTGQPTMTNVYGDYVAIGSTLTVGTGDWAPVAAGYVYSYQWVSAASCGGMYSSYDEIDGETSSALLVSSDLLDLCVGVVVTASAEGYNGAGTVTRPAGVAVVTASGSLSGYALDTHGTPVAGLELTIFGNTLINVTTDVNGYYSVSDLPFTTYSISWPAFGDYYPGFGSGTQTLTPASPTATFSVTPRIINRMHGTLTDADGLGIEGASFYFPGSGYTLNAVTDATGAFNRQLDFVGNSTYDLLFSMPTCTAANEYPATPFSIADTTVDVTFNDTVVDASNNASLLSFGGLPQITDSTPSIGQTISATTGSWNCASGATYDYQWYRDGTEVDGATASSYTVVAADGGAALSVKVWAVTSHGKKHGSLSEQTDEVEVGSAPTPSVSPSITWSGAGSAPMYGDTLGVAVGTWSVPGGATTYEWRKVAFNDGSWTVIGTGATLAAPADVAGSPGSAGRDSIEVIVRYSAPGYAIATYYPSAVRVDYAPAPVLLDPGSLVITGDVRVGEDVSADIGDWDIPGVSASYTGWRMGPVAGVGFGTISTGATFTIPATYDGYTAGTSSVGAYVEVGIIVTAPGHEPSAVQGATAGPILEPYLSTVTPVEIDGDGTVGWTLNVTEGSYTVTPATRSYEWFEGSSSSGPWTLLSDEDFVTPNLAQLGRYILLRESVTAGGGSAESESVPLLVDTDDPTWVSSDPWVDYTGTPVVGTTLTAVPGTWDRALDVVEHHWYLDGTDLVGSGLTYVPQPSDVGRYLSVQEMGQVTGGIPHYYYAVPGLVTAATPTPTPTGSPSPTASPAPTADPASSVTDDADGGDSDSTDDADDDADAEADTETGAEAGDADDPAASSDGDSAPAGAPGDGPAGADPTTTVLLVGGGVIVLGGLAAAGWWFFIRKPF